MPENMALRRKKISFKVLSANLVVAFFRVHPAKVDCPANIQQNLSKN